MLTKNRSASSRPRRHTAQDGRLLEAVDNNRARPDDAAGRQINALYDGRAGADMTAVADSYVSAHGRARSDMYVAPNATVVIYDRTRIHDTVRADPALRLEDYPGHDLYAFGKLDIARDDRRGVYDRCELVAGRLETIEQRLADCRIPDRPNAIHQQHLGWIVLQHGLIATNDPKATYGDADFGDVAVCRGEDIDATRPESLDQHDCVSSAPDDDDRACLTSGRRGASHAVASVCSARAV
jgi:hypothetical protein